MTPVQRSRGSVLILAALFPLVMTACVPASTGSAAVPTAVLPDGDATELAAWVHTLCDRGRQGTECRERALVRIAEERDIATAMDVVGRLELTDAEGHAATHMIGIRGYRSLDTADESFASCTPAYQSGCYHGVVQAYFADLGRSHDVDHLTEEMVSALCARYRDQEAGRWSLFQCLHGVGHGAMLVHDNHLPGALEMCDLLPTGWEREVCYGGAFMENAVSVIAPHHDHTAMALAGTSRHDDHDGHDHGHDHLDPHAHEDVRAHEEHAAHDHHGHDHHGRPGEAAESFPAIDPTDLHYPCSALEARYQMACYDMQTATMLHLLDYDIVATAAACRAAPDELLRSVCHRSLGRDINALTGGDHPRSAALCTKAAPTDRPSCHTGVVKNVIDVTADAASGIPYCERVPAGPERQACFRAIGEQTAVLVPRPTDRARFCQSLDAPDRESCTAGAGVRTPSADADS